MLEHSDCRREEKFRSFMSGFFFYIYVFILYPYHICYFNYHTILNARSNLCDSIYAIFINNFF